MLGSSLSRRRRLGVQLLVFCLGLAVVYGHTPAPEAFIADNDWGFQLAGANQILLGEHPFIDFPVYYGPLTFYASAFAQFAGGERPLAEIALATLGYALAYLLLFNLTWQASRKLSVAFIAVAVALLLMPHMYKYYIVLAPLATLSALWHWLKSPTRFSFCLVCLATAVAGLFRQDYGAFSAVASLVAIALQLDGYQRKLKGLSIFLLVMSRSSVQIGSSAPLTTHPSPRPPRSVLRGTT